MGVLMSAFVIAGCSSVPLMYNNYNKQRIETLFEFEELFKDVLQEISHLLSPITEALNTSKRHRSVAVQKTVDDFLYGLKKAQYSNISEVWSGALYYNKQQLQLKDNEFKVICKFGEYVDSHKSCDKYGMESSLKAVIENVHDLAVETKIKHDKSAAMYNKMGLLGGIGLSLFTI